jgi:SAM-dependent methyltransferase
MPDQDPRTPLPGAPTDPAAPSPPDSALASRGAHPTILALARLGPRRRFPVAAAELYRHIARVIELGPEQEFVVVPCGRGATAEFLATSTGAAGAGVDPDRDLIEAASAHAREARLEGRLHFEQAPLTDLPYQDEVFDITIGEIGLGAAADPAAAVRELVRITRPMGTVVLIQLTWTGSVEPARREALVEELGVRPLLLVEWKQLLRSAGVVDLYVEDWTDAGTPARNPWPFGGLLELRSLRDRTTVLWRAWRAWGWPGVRLALRATAEVRTLFARERSLGLSVIKGVRWKG